MTPPISATGEIAAAIAATIWAGRRPPRSRAINPVRTKTAPIASAAGSRTRDSDGPKRVRASRPMNGVRGG